MDIPILFEDDFMMVVEKPSGITVNTSDTTTDELTVQSWAEDKMKFGQLSSDAQTKESNEVEEGEYGNDFFKRGGIVHRLDKETSGILLIAKTPSSFLELQRQFRTRTVKKTYWALVHDKLTPIKGEIRVPVGRLSWDRKKFGVVAGGRESVTLYTVLSYYIDKSRRYYSYLELYPETGRTHQIRVHVKYLNHPVVSDTLYGGRKTARDDRLKLNRLFLHAAKITFQHPKTQEEMHFESKLPVELSDFVSTNLIKTL